MRSSRSGSHSASSELLRFTRFTTWRLWSPAGLRRREDRHPGVRGVGVCSALSFLRHVKQVRPVHCAPLAATVPLLLSELCAARHSHDSCFCIFPWVPGFEPDATVFSCAAGMGTLVATRLSSSAKPMLPSCTTAINLMSAATQSLTR
eukprot:SAG11_NODE_1173_length_5602_cov_35.121933_1_plen_148_part_00